MRKFTPGLCSCPECADRRVYRLIFSTVTVLLGVAVTVKLLGGY